VNRLWIARHAEAVDDESALSARGRLQALLLGARLAGVPITRISHSPLPRAAETATIVAGALPGVPVAAAPELTDSDPSESPEAAAAMVTRFGRPAADELLITHNFQVAWFVRDALSAPAERWRGLNQCNAALTVIGYREGRPPAVVAFNEMSHLPEELRWTGFPEELRLP
jgi:probable phosphoglycerate mutase